MEKYNAVVEDQERTGDGDGPDELHQTETFVVPSQSRNCMCFGGYNIGG